MGCGGGACGRIQLCTVSLGLLLFVIASQATMQPNVATIELYLTNATLDADVARQSSNTAYFGVFGAGTPAEQFTGCFDTGSADAWLPLSSCQSQSCQSHTTFSPNASSTYQASSTPFSIQYATGAVYGNVAHDTLTFGGIQVPNQAIGVVSTAGAELLQSSCDGIVGFGFQTLSQLKAPAPFFTMVADSLLAQNTFSFWFSQYGAAEPAGELVIGGVNAARTTGSTTFVTLQNSTYWSLPLLGVSVEQQNVIFSAKTAVLDTSSTAINLGITDAASLHQRIPGAVYSASLGLYNISGGCDNIASQPTVSFSFGNSTFAIPPNLWVINYEGSCVSGFVPSSSNQIVLGVPFLRAWHTQYSYNPSTAQATIGLTAPVQTPSGSGGSSQISFAGRRLSRAAFPSAIETRHQSLFSASIPGPQQRGLLP